MVFAHSPHPTISTTGQQVLSRDLHAHFGVTMDTDSVRDCFSCSKSLQVGQTVTTLHIYRMQRENLNPIRFSIKAHTQHDPHEPWSLISLRVGQLGHCSLGSKLCGSFISPAYCTLKNTHRKKQNSYFKVICSSIHLK